MDVPLVVGWDDAAIVGNHVASPMKVAASGAVEPGARLHVRLPLSRLPQKKTVVELILPTVVRGTPREYHYAVRTQ
jgi:hypothetical protein